MPTIRAEDAHASPIAPSAMRFPPACVRGGRCSALKNGAWLFFFLAVVGVLRCVTCVELRARASCIDLQLQKMRWVRLGLAELGWLMRLMGRLWAWAWHGLGVKARGSAVWLAAGARGGPICWVGDGWMDGARASRRQSLVLVQEEVVRLRGPLMQGTWLASF
ncbi:hypothetical protein VFPBJ_03225 [Purpureocillium lilacinum]|uniref:Uncharacterized protein n=1 Tax=Purpureocillium lilacinum TaxID=33203 RepID=A0A179H2H0_PURLI|nr:hypothetical protein VFPBJ_03225 [Purpureocillium lilacinum]